MRFVFALLIFLAPLGAAAQRCHADRILNIDSSGQYIWLQSGWRLQVFPGGEHVSVLWLPRNRLDVCAIGGSALALTNDSVRGATIRALRLF